MSSTRQVKRYYFCSIQNQWLPLIESPEGLWLGYSVFTTFRWPIEQQWFEAHWHRLTIDAEAFGLATPAFFLSVQSCWQGLVQRFGDLDYKVRLTLCADTGNPQDFQQNEAPLPTAFCLAFSPIEPLPDEPPVISLVSKPYVERGPTHKHGSRLTSLQLRRQVVPNAQTEVLWEHPDWGLTETTVGFLAVLLSERVLCFPPKEVCLPSITAYRVKTLAEQGGLTVREQPILLQHRAAWVGLLTGNSVQGIQRVCSLNGEKVPVQQDIRWLL